MQVLSEDKESQSKEDEDLSIDFSKVKKIFKRPKKEKVKTETVDSEEENIDFDFKKIGSFFAKYRIVLLILIPLLFAIFLRAAPAYLPATDNWAEDSVYSNLQDNIRSQINQNYPNLPEQNKQKLINDEFKKLLKEHKSEINSQIDQTSNYFKSRFQDESGQTYLLAIDPYHYYRLTLNYIDHGHLGSTEIDGKPVETFIQAPSIREPNKLTFHSASGAFFIGLWSLFGNDNSLAAFFWLPVIMSAIAIIPAFFIGRRFGGDVGGFFSALIIAIAPSFLSRTVGGFADTDSYTVLFPLLILMFIMFARDNFDNRKWWIHTTLAGLFTGLFMFAWTGWWYVFIFVVASLIISLIIKLIAYKDSRKIELKNFVKFILLYLISGAIFSLIFKGGVGFAAFWRAFTNPMSFASIKTVGISSVWPNVYTTVAELNSASLKSIINNIGGNLLFLLAIVGIILLLIYAFKKEDSKKFKLFFPVLLILWFIGTLFASTKGIRFTLLLVPAFGIALGCCFGIAFTSIKKFLSNELKINKLIVAIVLIFVAFLLLGFSPIPPFMTSGYAKTSLVTIQNEVPSMNDAWFDTLKEIDEKAPEQTIINSWWDFGHWFKAIGNRPVTFDGGSQNTPQAH